MMSLPTVEIRLRNPRDPLPVLLSEVLKYNSEFMLNSWSSSFSVSGMTKCAYFPFFFTSKEKLKD